MKQRTVILIESGEVKTRIDLPDGKYYADILSADKRSNPQNRYYHGLVVPIIQKGMKDLGNDVSLQEVHEFLKSKFNFSELVNQETGKLDRIPMSTTRMNKGEFVEFIQKIQRFASEWLHIEIPDPGEQTEIKYNALKK